MSSLQLTADRIDHTLLKAEATAADAEQTFRDARGWGCASACVNPVHLAAAVRALAGSNTVPCVVVGFPLGTNTPQIKSIEATSLAKAGAMELDFVAHLPHLLACDLDAATEDFLSVTRPAREVSGNTVVKVILETALLMQTRDVALAERRIELACRAAAESGCDFVKTSTGFHAAGGATIEAVRLLRKHAPHLGVKASGGIRSPHEARGMLDAGADRLGCSATAAVLGHA